MDNSSEWLEKILWEERQDILQLLDLKHKSLIATFKDRLAQENDAPVPNIPPPKEYERKFSTKSSCDQLNERKSYNRVLLTRFFELIDQDRSGSITLDEVRAALQRVGQSPAEARKLVKQMNEMCKKTGGVTNGEISKDDWVRAVEAESNFHEEICDLAREMAKRALDDARKKKQLSSACMLSVDSHYRLLWDALCSLCVVYIAVFAPYWFAFASRLDDTSELIPKEIQKTIAYIIDVIFMVDIVINFRTTYFQMGREIRNWRKVALHYLRSWFLIDAVASIPFSFIEDYSSLTNNSGSVKLLKIVRLVTIMKVVRTARAVHYLSHSRLGQSLESWLIENRLQGKDQILLIILSLLFCCHWLACAMVSCGMQFLDQLSEGLIEPGSYYIPSFYWAMTTVTTVGYGDITPRNDSERAVAMLAMCLGGMFYALNASIVTSTLLAQNRAAAERTSKMQVVNHWLNRHEFPRALKQRLHRYFKGYLGHTENSTREEIDLFDDLTSDLRLEVALVLVPEEVRVVPIFACVPNFVTGFLVSILQMVSFRAKEDIVKEGECGVAMYVIMRGCCVKETRASTNDTGSTGVLVAKLFVGESFGEEIILNLAEEYSYNVSAQTESDLYTIAENLFERSMSGYPHHLETMRDCFKQSTLAEAQSPRSPVATSRKPMTERLKWSRSGEETRAEYSSIYMI